MLHYSLCNKVKNSNNSFLRFEWQENRDQLSNNLTTEKNESQKKRTQKNISQITYQTNKQRIKNINHEKDIKRSLNWQAWKNFDKKMCSPTNHQQENAEVEMLIFGENELTCSAGLFGHVSNLLISKVENSWISIALCTNRQNCSDIWCWNCYKNMFTNLS